MELAVRGKLVAQNPADEPASVLLERIAAEKASLVKAGKIKKKKALSPIAEEEKPFVLPKNWYWARLQDIGHDWGQKKPDGDFTYIEVSGIDNATGTIKFPKKLTAAEAPSRARKIVSVGTVIYSTVRPYLKNICVIEQEYHPEPIASTAFAVVHPFQKMPGKFFTLYLKSPSFVSYVESVQTGIAYPAINDKQFFYGVTPIPPLAEQNRIVAKVDELMTLCDRLEKQQTDSTATHQALLTTLLDALTKSANHAEFATTWQRIAEHFDLLFTTDQSIDQLKQTILQLAVMGKLVPQNPDDEPASVLLEKIAAEKAQLVKAGKMKKQKKLPEIGDEEKPFELPEGWGFVRLVEISKLITKGSSPKWQGVNYTEKKEGILFITSENVGRYKLKLEKKKYVEKKFNEVEPRSILKKDDFLMNIVGASIGRTAVYDIDELANINQAVCLIRVFSQFIDKKYLLYFFNSEFCLSYMFDKQVDNARANLSMGNIAKFLIPFPPLPEQHRIVAKVDELMTLCDTLKSGLQQAQTTQVQLADALVEQAVA
ncbi:MAG: restriction endonuclease subunit S [Candidatus Electrothrix sp. Rat3]|nr:restriction endonuclease subunit S [Candidatus Electrothrix rattekaaiensis]